MTVPSAAGSSATKSGATALDPTEPSPPAPLHAGNVPRAARVRLSGWGNIRASDANVYRVERQAELRQVLGNRSSLIARGAGRSYGDSATNENGAVMLCERLDRILAFDDATGEVRCECGVRFADLVDTFLPRGWFPIVTPGTQFVTVGGAIASDVHGKNHHADGTFGRGVTELGLLVPDGRAQRVTRDADAELFRATLGGMGLTGVVTDASFRLLRVPSAYLQVQYRVAAGLEDALAKLDAASDAFRYSVAWIDGLAAGDALGRSVVISGAFAEPAALPAGLRERPYEIKRPRARAVPIHLPRVAFNRATVRLFNAAYYRRHRDETRVADYRSFFYPLDAIRHWNRLYGRRGFIQYQALLPPETARSGLQRLLAEIAAAGAAPFLGVLKRTGAAGEGLLSFPRPGYSLALDMPWFDGIPALTARLDQILIDHGGRVYLAKDASLSRDSFEAMYPAAAEFKAVRARVDPGGRMASDQARRLGLA